MLFSYCCLGLTTQSNYTEYTGDDKFLSDATPRTNELMKKVHSLYEDNLDIVDRFYSTHKEAYSDISNDLIKIKSRGRRTK